MDLLKELQFICDTAAICSGNESNSISFANNYATVTCTSVDENNWQINLEITDKNKRIVELFKHTVEGMDDDKFVEQCSKFSPAFISYLDEMLKDPKDYTIQLINEFLTK